LTPYLNSSFAHGRFIPGTPARSAPTCFFRPSFTYSWRWKKFLFPSEISRSFALIHVLTDDLNGAIIAAHGAGVGIRRFALRAFCPRHRRINGQPHLRLPIENLARPRRWRRAPPELVGLMEPEEAEDVRRLMAYDEYTAGGLMTTEPIILPPESTVATFLAQSRKAEIPPALAAVGFVCRPPLESPTGKFVGMIHFQRALRERPQRMVGSIVDTDVDSVRPEDSIGTVTRLLATYNLTALPVLDDAGRLLGAVSVDDVLDHLMPDDWRVADEAVTDETIERGANA